MRYATFAAAILLCSCDPGSTAEADEESFELQPGRWVGTVEFSMPSAPADNPVLAPQRGTIDRCLTPVEAASPAVFLAGGADAQCDTSAVTVAGGRIGGTVSCRRPDGVFTTRLAGSYTPTSYQLDTTSDTMSGRATVSTS